MEVMAIGGKMMSKRDVMVGRGQYDLPESFGSNSLSGLNTVLEEEHGQQAVSKLNTKITLPSTGRCLNIASLR